MSRAALVDLIDRSRRVLVFTGAGVSTESGVPDFRSPGGVWSRMTPIAFQDFVSSNDARREAWTRTFSGTAGWTGRQPNAGHAAVAALVASGKVQAVVTQNVDNLHQASGVPQDQVIELHGNASHAACLDCGERHELAELKAPFLSDGDIPACRRCGGLVKQATISFGQPMPKAPMRRAEQETLACDLFLVLGCSLRVFPAAAFPLVAKRRGARLAIVNREPTKLDPQADLILHDEIGPAMSEVVERLGEPARPQSLARSW